MKSERFLSEVDLYHNPDPLLRLVGKPNESEVFIDDRKVAGIDRLWGAAILNYN